MSDRVSATALFPPSSGRSVPFQRHNMNSDNTTLNERSQLHPITKLPAIDKFTKHLVFSISQLVLKITDGSNVVKCVIVAEQINIHDAELLQNQVQAEPRGGTLLRSLLRTAPTQPTLILDANGKHGRQSYLSPIARQSALGQKDIIRQI